MPPSTAAAKATGDPATRARILDAAERLFAERGFEGTSTRAITDAAGVAAGLAFYYFPKKADILDAIVTERGLAAVLEASLARHASLGLRDLLIAVGEDFVAGLRQRRAVIRTVLPLLLADPQPPAAERVRAVIEGETTALAAVLADRLDVRARDHAAAKAQALIAALVVREIFGVGPTSVAAMVDGLLDGRG